MTNRTDCGDEGSNACSWLGSVGANPTGQSCPRYGILSSSQFPKRGWDTPVYLGWCTKLNASWCKRYTLHLCPVWLAGWLAGWWIHCTHFMAQKQIGANPTGQSCPRYGILPSSQFPKRGWDTPVHLGGCTKLNASWCNVNASRCTSARPGWLDGWLDGGFTIPISWRRNRLAQTQRVSRAHAMVFCPCLNSLSVGGTRQSI